VATTDAQRARLAGEMHDAIERFVAMCAEDEPGLDPARFDYRIDIHREGSSATYPLIYKT
jgi:hypothetical protein